MRALASELALPHQNVVKPRSSIKVHHSLVKSGGKRGMFLATQGGCWLYFALRHGLGLPS